MDVSVTYIGLYNWGRRFKNYTTSLYMPLDEVRVFRIDGHWGIYRPGRTMRSRQ